MRAAALCCLIALCLWAGPAFAQDVLENTNQDPETTVTAPADGEVAPEDQPAPVEDIPLLLRKKEYTDMPQVRLRILDKVRALSRTYDLDVGHTVAYANIRIRPRACRKSSPLDDPENAAFLQIWEVKPDRKSDWVFSGWMFSSSPSLSAMDHPVYDVTVLECLDPKTDAKNKNQESAAPGRSSESDETGLKHDKSETDAALDAYIADDKDAPAEDGQPMGEDKSKP